MLLSHLILALAAAQQSTARIVTQNTHGCSEDVSTMDGVPAAEAIADLKANIDAAVRVSHLAASIGEHSDGLLQTLMAQEQEQRLMGYTASKAHGSGPYAQADQEAVLEQFDLLGSGLEGQLDIFEFKKDYIEKDEKCFNFLLIHGYNIRFYEGYHQNLEGVFSNASAGLKQEFAALPGPVIERNQQFLNDLHCAEPDVSEEQQALGFLASAWERLARWL